MTVAGASVWKKKCSSVLEFKLIYCNVICCANGLLCGCDNYYCHVMFHNTELLLKNGESFQYLRSFSMAKSILVKHFDINTRGNLIKSDQ